MARPSGSTVGSARKKPSGRTASLLSSLKKLEKRFGQKNLANMIGIAPRSLRRYKDGTRVPRYDVAFKIKRAERLSRGLRKTKSVKKKALRAAKILDRHPEIKYFEKERVYRYAERKQIYIVDVSKADVPTLLEYLEGQGAEAAFFVASGVDPGTGKRVFASSPIMIFCYFKSVWESLYYATLEGINFGEGSKPGKINRRVDLVGVFHAPTAQEGQD